MSNPTNYLMRACMFACVLFTATSCKDTDDSLTNKTGEDVEDTTPFDFSTSQRVSLTVDYSAFNAKIPVFFSVYNENPFVDENNIGEYINPDVKPIFSGYTNKDGKFSDKVTLPAYAKNLHVVTGNFLVGLRRNMVAVANGEATLVVPNPMATAGARKVAARVPGTGTSTNDLSTMHNLSWTINSNGSKSQRVYLDWVTPLGTWNSASGRPDYLLTEEEKAAKPSLVFSEEEFNGMYGTACAALNSATDMKEQYRAKSDLLLIKDSEVSITAMGSSTCWNSALGYYFYNENNPPQKKIELNIIMIFPNTQDGEWPRGSYPKNNYKGNIGTQRGDVVQLKYYPNLLSPNTGDRNFEGETTKFPKGTKIGFILKANAWGCLGSDYSVNSCTNKINIWGASTDGFSTSPKSGVKFPNPAGDSRTAKFSYTSPEGNEYVVVSFEDACDDKDYDDLMFALNPAGAFDFGSLAQIESRIDTISGVYAFEDMWPKRGDYDMNDAVLDSKHEIELYGHGQGSNHIGLAREKFYITTDKNFAGRSNGLAVKLNTEAASDIATIYVDKIAPGEKAPSADPNRFKVENKMYYYLPEFTRDGYTFYLTNDIKLERGATYTLEVNYSKSQPSSKTTAAPFLYRKEGNKYWEMHLPYEKPTDKMNTKYFGTEDDRSIPSEGYYFIGDSMFPFAFFLYGAGIEQFQNTLLNKDNESVRIDELYPEFIEWSKSKGAKNKDWYLHPAM